MSDVLLKKLKSIKEEIEVLNKKYNNIVSELGYDLEICDFCKGDGWYSRYAGSDCNGSHYDTVKCIRCKGEKYILKEVK